MERSELRFVYAVAATGSRFSRFVLVNLGNDFLALSERRRHHPRRR